MCKGPSSVSSSLRRGMLVVRGLYSRPSGRRPMAANYTALIQQHGAWWIGWVEEVPGVNSQGQTREELLANLWSGLEEALEMNRVRARAAANGAYEEVSLPPVERGRENGDTSQADLTEGGSTASQSGP